MNIFKVKTPHRRPWRHLAFMFGYFFVAALVTTFFGLGASAPSIGTALAASAVTGFVSLVGGIFVTMVLRSAFGLVQTGRVLQYAGFWLATLPALSLASWLTGATVGSAGLAALVVVVIAFTGATLAGEVPTKGRTWLPMRRKDK